MPPSKFKSNNLNDHEEDDNFAENLIRPIPSDIQTAHDEDWHGNDANHDSQQNHSQNKANLNTEYNLGYRERVLKTDKLSKNGTTIVEALNAIDLLCN